MLQCVTTNTKKGTDNVPNQNQTTRLGFLFNRSTAREKTVLEAGKDPLLLLEEADRCSVSVVVVSHAVLRLLLLVCHDGFPDQLQVCSAEAPVPKLLQHLKTMFEVCPPPAEIRTENGGPPGLCGAYLLGGGAGWRLEEGAVFRAAGRGVRQGRRVSGNTFCLAPILQSEKQVVLFQILHKHQR